ncbi:MULTISPECIES: isoprenylcysteine carboxylmethyltransferase family protein [Rhodomicrobium]|uniref:methyltransferase family protein n=1 Tax=Rhodomicrobium TaxID=1068 RepID=UPI000B4A8B3E|nr:MULTISPECIES: isoprenylcysteine carboxylmethyltransferase family protein [Rhodomicrobium]
MASAPRTPVRDHSGVVAPPPLIYFGVLALGLTAGWAAGEPGIGLPLLWRLALGAIFAVPGIMLIVSASHRFQDAGTNVEPWRPSTALVTAGVYRFTRNPIYVGMALVYIGLCIFADSLVAIAWLPAALLIVHHGVIRREERYLEAKFGEAYLAYKGSVRRWV